VLTDRWDAAAVALGGTPRGGQELEIVYAAGDRSYHDTTHIEQVLRDSDALGLDLGLSPRQRAIVALAACAHDVVYDGKPGEDERASAAWALETLTGQRVPAEDAREVARLIEGTITHAADPADLPSVALMDADLAVLGSEPAAYDAYARKVRQEYAVYDDATWALGRTAVLEDLLSHEQLYVSQAARDRWESAARANLARELTTYR
jgi:predicted metal-dependent HD superfamily phosphohydrolase